jgi:hypothetical protein
MSQVFGSFVFPGLDEKVWQLALFVSPVVSNMPGSGCLTLA